MSYEAERFEVPFELVGKKVWLVFDPHTRKVLGVEAESGESLGSATPLDLLANCHRKRSSALSLDNVTRCRTGTNLVEMALAQQTHRLGGHTLSHEEEV